MIHFLPYLFLRRFSTRSAVIGKPRQTFSLPSKGRVRGEVIYKMNIYRYDSDQSNYFISPLNPAENSSNFLVR